MDVSYYRDDSGKWWVLVNGQGHPPVKKETSELMEIAFQTGSTSYVDKAIDREKIRDLTHFGWILGNARMDKQITNEEFSLYIDDQADQITALYGE